MKKSIALACAAAATAAFATVPNVTNVKMSQGRTPLVTITYTLDGPAVVTVDVQTNRGDNTWASIGGENLTSVSGDVNKQVGAGNRTITWSAGEDWPKHAFSGNDKIKAVVTAWALDATPDYMAASLENASTVFYYASADTVPGGVTNDMYKTTWLLMRRIPAQGKLWRMGISPIDGAAHNWTNGTARCKPQLVQLSQDYYIGVYPVTQGQFDMIRAQYPAIKYPYWNATDKNKAPEGDNAGDKKPKPYARFDYIRNGTWPGSHDVTATDADLYGFRQFTGIEFDLPTEAQWEFACRAGTDTSVYTGKEWTEENVNEVAFTKSNSGETPHLQDVGQKPPNGFGLYDMIGNIWEICLDWYCDFYHCGPDSGTHDHAATSLPAGLAYDGVVVDPVGPAIAWDHDPQNKYRYPRVVKGGCYGDGWQWSGAQTRSTASGQDGWMPLWQGYRMVAPMGGTW